MRIGIDISQIVHGTGVSNYTLQLVEHLAKIDKKNEYVLFGASLRGIGRFKELKEKLQDSGNFQFKIVPIPPIILEFLWNRLHLVAVEKFTGPLDIFHSSDWTEPPTSKDAKTITTVHDLVAFLFPSSSHPKIVSVQKKRLNLVKEETDLILADSQSTKDDLVKIMHIEPEKIKVVYLAPAAHFKPQDEGKINEVIAKYKIRKPYLLSVATQEPRKNIQKVLDVFEKLVAKRPNLQLVLSGKYGWGKGLHFSSTAQDDKIIWTGYVPTDDLVCLYSGARLFVYPSLYEGFGLPILEAMSCGTPVVCSNNSSMAEIAKDTAILIDPRSEGQLQKAIEMVLDLNLENYQKMVRASLDRARRFTWTKTARATLEAYEELRIKNKE